MSATESTPVSIGHRARLLIAYRGGSFHGFAPNLGVSTVAGTLTDALERVLRAPVALVGAGRTDAGVHAWGQVVSLDVAAGVDLSWLMRRVNAQCAPDLVVRAAEWAPAGFNARFSAEWRRYRYTIVNRRVPDPFRSDTAWHVERPLSVSCLRLATDVLIGEHDFASFCRRPKGDPDASLVRRVLDARWSVVETADDGDEPLVRFEITGTAFCHQMVRSIVGSLVDVGTGRRRPSDIGSMLRARTRAAAGQVAPPHGLCLWEVGYGADPDGSLPFAV